MSSFQSAFWMLMFFFKAPSIRSLHIPQFPKTLKVAVSELLKIVEALDVRAKKMEIIENKRLLIFMIKYFIWLNERQVFSATFYGLRI